MTIDHFQALSPQTQKDLTVYKGVPLAKKQTQDYSTVLYDVNGFYVELYYPPQEDRVVWVNSFETTDELEFYLEDIDVTAVCYP
jgi:hypothetical protein